MKWQPTPCLPTQNEWLARGRTNERYQPVLWFVTPADSHHLRLYLDYASVTVAGQASMVLVSLSGAPQPSLIFVSCSAIDE